MHPSVHEFLNYTNTDLLQRDDAIHLYLHMNPQVDFLVRRKEAQIRCNGIDDVRFIEACMMFHGPPPDIQSLGKLTSYYKKIAKWTCPLCTYFNRHAIYCSRYNSQFVKISAKKKKNKKNKKILVKRKNESKPVRIRGH